MSIGLRVYSPPEADRIWLWAYFNKIPIYPVFYLLKGDYEVPDAQYGMGEWAFGRASPVG